MARARYGVCTPETCAGGGGGATVGPCEPGGSAPGGHSLCVNNLLFRRDPDPGLFQGGPEIEIHTIPWAPRCDPAFVSNCFPPQQYWETSPFTETQIAGEFRNGYQFFNADDVGVRYSALYLVMSSSPGSWESDVQINGPHWVYLLDDDTGANGYPTFLDGPMCQTRLSPNDDYMGRIIVPADIITRGTTGIIFLEADCDGAVADLEIYAQ